MFLSIDSFIICLYLIITLVVGIYSGRNIKTFKEFAIGNYKFSTSVLMATITATWIDAELAIGIHETVYSQGIVWLIIFLGGVISIYIFQLLAPKIYRFKGALSAAEILGTWYGDKARIIGGFCIVSRSIGALGSQITAIGFLCHEFFQISPVFGIILGAGIVVFYSSFGGIKSVTYTDVIQFAFFVVAIPLVANVLLAKAGGYSKIIDSLPTEHFKIIPNYGNWIEYLVFFIFFAIPFCDACLIQRVLMAQNEKQIVDSFKSTAIIMVVFYVICTIIALSALTLNPGLKANTVLYFIINNYLPIGIKGIAMAGLLAVIMSTADSYLNTASITIIHDVINKISTKRLNGKQELLIVQFINLFIGVCAILIAINFQSITELMLKSDILWAPIAIVPLYAAIIGIRSNLTVFIIAGICGMIVKVSWMVFDLDVSTGISSAMPSLTCNLIGFTLTTLWYNYFAPDKLISNDLKAWKKSLHKNQGDGKLLQPILES